MTPRGFAGPRFFIEGLSQLGVSHLTTPFALPEKISHHIRNVLRLQVGAAIEIADPKTAELYIAKIASLNAGVTVTLEAALEPTQRGLYLAILCALCKGDKNERICDWATELGCSQIIFWQAERSIVRLKDRADASSKERKLSDAAWAAAQQSRQPTPPIVGVKRSLEEAIEAIDPVARGSMMYGSLEEEAPLLSDILPRIKSIGGCTIAIGPEGSISPKESELLRSRGFTPISLGQSVLRSELAALTAIVTVMR